MSKPTYEDLEKQVRELEYLRKNEDKFLAILQASPVPMALNDEQQNITFLNTAFVETFGYTQKDIPMLADWWLRAYPDLVYRERVINSWQNELKKMKDSDAAFSPMELIVRCKNGIDKTVVATASPLSESFEGEHLVVLYDITDRKRAEEKVIQSEKGFRTLAEACNAGIGIHDNGFLLHCNKAFAALFGYTRAELVGRNIIALAAPESEGLIKKNIINNGEEKYEAVGLKKDGSRIFGEIQGRPITYKGKKARVVTLNDLTERIQAEKLLRLSETRYREFIEGTDNLVTRVDSLCNFIFINQMSEKYYGVKPDKCLGMQALDFVHPDDQEKTKKWYDDCSSQRVAQSSIENRQVNTTTGDISTMLWRSSFVYDDEGNLKGINGIAHDISAQKILEEERIKTKKLASTAVLAGGIAHDFNNLLGAVIGNIDMVLEDIGPDNPANRLLENAYRASLKGKELTGKFLTFAKGGAPVKKITSIEKPVIDSVQVALSDSNIEYDFSPRHDLWLTEVDSNQISQVFHNIVLNAKEAMPQGGRLQIKASNIEAKEMADQSVILEGKGDYVKISFSDTGCGIDNDVLVNVFDPYFTSKEMGEQKGMGLGLTVVNSIITQHNGLVDIESDPGVGTTVHIYLPASKLQQAETEAPSDAHSYKILFMDDEELIRELAESMFTRLGHTITLVRCGEEAIQLYIAAAGSSRPFDAVIFDLTIKGGMGGEATLKKLLEIDSGIKAIVTSGYSSSESPVLSNPVKYGFKAVILKPFIKKEIQKILEYVLTS